MRKFPTASFVIQVLLGMVLIGCFEETLDYTEIRFVSNRNYYPSFHRLSENATESISAVLYLAKFYKGRETQVNIIMR